MFRPGWLTVVAVWLMVAAVPPGVAVELLILGSSQQPLWQHWVRLRQPTIFSLPSASSATPLQGFFVGLSPSAPNIRPTSDWTALCRSGIQAVITADVAAARAALRDCPLPMVLMGIAPNELAPLLLSAQQQRLPVAAIRLEADPRLNLQLMRTLLPQSRKIGLLRAANAPDWLTPLLDEAHRLNFEIQEIVANSDLEAVRALRSQLIGLEAVLLPPDPILINEWSLKPLLMMTVRQGIPVFGGLTAPYVDAGVMASVVADENRVFDQALVLSESLKRDSLAPVYPIAVRVVINANIARILGFSPEILVRAQSLFKRS